MMVVLLEDGINELCQGMDRWFCPQTAANYFIRCSMLVALVLCMNEKLSIQESFEGVAGVQYHTPAWCRRRLDESKWIQRLVSPS
jgi:hypothetical protein